MISDYIQLARPRTLPLGLIPVLVSLTYAYHGGYSPDPWLIAVALACPALLQIAANAHNDAKDHEKGADSEGRLGPKRMAASGEMGVDRIKRFAWICAGLAVMAGGYAVLERGWGALILGLMCVAGAFSYTGGRKPVAYSPLGEAYVVFFFGLVAVNGTFYVLTGVNDFSFYPVGISLGLLGANVLLVNNYRDMESDAKAGRRTLCMVIGRKRALLLYKIFIAGAQFLTLWSLQRHFAYPFFFLPFLALPLFMKTARSFENNPVDRTLNAILARSVMLQAIHSTMIVFAYIGDYLIQRIVG